LEDLAIFLLIHEKKPQQNVMESDFAKGPYLAAKEKPQPTRILLRYWRLSN